MAKNIMLQGTASSVGKTILTAALCRIFKQEGYSVAPFKSQNMTSNSFITKSGKEIAMSQAIQAEAAKIEATAEMNPILLKPTSDKNSKVVINGELTSNMPAALYQKEKLKLKNVVKDAYNNLDDKFDIVIIEGAGSPAEINLNKNDIANMGLAKLVNASVIIVGDIDKGGIFAAIYGTIMLLSEEEKDRVKGFIINKFRGDLEILKPGIKMLEDLVDKPCLGVVPYFDINIDAKDNLVTSKEIREQQYDKLASIVKENININYIKTIIGIDYEK